jgi:C4-dicarboxylate transporter DctQ subunit
MKLIKIDKRMLTYYLKKCEANLMFIIKVICFSLFIIIIFDVFTAVIARYIFHLSTNFADQLSKYLVIWMVFLASSIGFSEGGHVSVEILKKKMPLNYQKAMFILIDILLSAFFIIIIIHGFKIAIRAKIFSDPLVFGISMIYPYMAIPIGFLIMLMEINLLAIIHLINTDSSPE